ncbi:helix-turn-helix domain-containing protein [Tropicimonas sediminicola]|uniref:DNA binding domain-containing protein, excisionase family n=1 Tax=Tropicimonas sediminicola TaxID=1031541 RepID=A0A239FKQ0_9RHOB|nr:helix-turn-helix domain-containing protein [Tropicimonas sediminicola]SNS56792.1 DNA binding domain-containing protein, excisionase family [Tropicimonas sediminicola]
MPKPPDHSVPPRSETSDLTIKEVCSELRVAPATVYRMLKSGELAGYKFGENNWSTRITRQSVDALKRRQPFEPKGAA